MVPDKSHGMVCLQRARDWLRTVLCPICWLTEVGGEKKNVSHHCRFLNSSQQEWPEGPCHIAFFFSGSGVLR